MIDLKKLQRAIESLTTKYSELTVGKIINTSMNESSNISNIKNMENSNKFVDNQTFTEFKNQVIKEFEGYGNEQKKLMKLKMRIIFGGNFSPLWFFPCFKGGKINYNSIVGQKKKENTNKRKKISRKGLFK